MEFRSPSINAPLAAVLALAAAEGCAAPGSNESTLELDSTAQALGSTNDLKSFNGLKPFNGLSAINGLPEWPSHHECLPTTNGCAPP